VTGDRIVLGDDEAHHLFRVRRVRVGEKVYASTGEGDVYGCVVAADHTLQIHQRLENFGEPTVFLSLGMAGLKGDMNRDVVDLATQLGVREILFFQGERSEGRLTEERIERLRRTALTAVKQCGRAWLPKIQHFKDLAALLSRLPGGAKVFMANPVDSSVSIGHAPGSISQAVLLVGPEGGFTEHEFNSAMQAGAANLHLGDRRLRSELAAAAGLSFLLTAAADFRERHDG
jgi:16S rRNA (uracil1498-N3)-methyltransferase